MTFGASKAATTITHKPALAPLRNPGQFRRRERYRPNPPLKGVPFDADKGTQSNAD